MVLTFVSDNGETVIGQAVSWKSTLLRKPLEYKVEKYSRDDSTAARNDDLYCFYLAVGCRSDSYNLFRDFVENKKKR